MADKKKKNSSLEKKSKNRRKEVKSKEKKEEEKLLLEMKDQAPDVDDSSVSVYDSPTDGIYEDDSEGEEEEEEYDSNVSVSESDDNEDVGDEDEFEDQGSSDEDEELLQGQIKKANEEESDEELEFLPDIEAKPRNWNISKRDSRGMAKDSSIDDEPKISSESGNADNPALAEWMHTDDLSSDDEDPNGENNRIGAIPLHWYDEYDHIGYNVHGTKMAKSVKGDLLDQHLEFQQNLRDKNFVVHDALNGKDVQLTDRQLELIRRFQAGAFAHPEHDANPDYIAYYSGVDKQVSGINSDRHEPKSRFQPSKFEKMQVRRLLHKLEKGDITMEYLKGDVRDVNDQKRKNKKEGENDQPFMMWKGNEEDELHLRKGPMHIAAPKLPPPEHAESYNPPDEYLPTEDEVKEWEDMDVQDRPHGLLVPKKYPNLRSVGAYEHAIRERFERCLDLYLCPRVMKRRLNIDPESLVPSLPKASDLRPYPTSRCIQYDTPLQKDGSAPMICCLTVSPDGQFMASGASDGYVRLWEVETGRLLRSWNVSILNSDDGKHDSTSEKESTHAEVKPVVALEWNPNSSHHCLLAAVGKCVIVIATGTGGPEEAELTDALLSSAMSCNGDNQNLQNSKAAKAVNWKSVKAGGSNDLSGESYVPLSAFGGVIGPVVILRTTAEVSSAKWHRKGDYFVTVSPKAGASSVLIHQLNKANSQQPFSKSGKDGDVQCACFHPSKPFLFVAARQHIRIYHLVKQAMVKRLISGCKWICSMDVHQSGDHVIVASLDKRMVWFDLDLSSTPYKTLRYHERGVRCVGFHRRYPLMASSSDDGTVHVFHSTVYTDLTRNPLIVPVKILRGHEIVNKYGVLSFAFHPNQPWLFSSGADGVIHLYQDI